MYSSILSYVKAEAEFVQTLASPPPPPLGACKRCVYRFVTSLALFRCSVLANPGLIDDPKEALAVKALFQSHLPTLNQVHASRR